VTGTMGTVDEDINTFMTICQWILLRTRNVSEKKVVEKSKHTFHVQYFFFSWQSYHLWDVEKYCRARKATNYNIIWSRKDVIHVLAITARIQTQSWLLHGNNRYANMPQCYIIHILPVMFYFVTNANTGRERT
jgi:hypothetical protein